MHACRPDWLWLRLEGLAWTSPDWTRYLPPMPPCLHTSIPAGRCVQPSVCALGIEHFSQGMVGCQTEPVPLGLSRDVPFHLHPVPLITHAAAPIAKGWPILLSILRCTKYEHDATGSFKEAASPLCYMPTYFVPVISTSAALYSYNSTTGFSFLNTCLPCCIYGYYLPLLYNTTTYLIPACFPSTTTFFALLRPRRYTL